DVVVAVGRGPDPGAGEAPAADRRARHLCARPDGDLRSLVAVHTLHPVRQRDRPAGDLTADVPGRGRPAARRPADRPATGRRPTPVDRSTAGGRAELERAASPIRVRRGQSPAGTVPLRGGDLDFGTFPLLCETGTVPRGDSPLMRRRL